MHKIMRLFLVAVFTLAAISANSVHAVNVSLDYSYDTSDFFGAGNPDGAAAGTQARNALEAAADYFSDILTDTLSSIQTPATFHSGPFSGVFTWEWELSFPNPGTGVNTSLFDQTIAEDEYRIYVGARSLTGNTLGEGGPGGWGWSGTPSGAGFTSGEIDQINAISDAFSSDISTRGEPTGFANWGGAATFDNDGSTTWHYDHTATVEGGKSDLYSVAIHEIGHAVGLGTADEWDALIGGTSFFGTAAVNEFGGPVPLDCSGSCSGHWNEGTNSEVFGTSNSQEAAMDPTVASGNRKYLTALDAAALTDIGWSVSTPTFYAPGDFDLDGDVDDDDFLTFEASFAANGNADTDSDGDTDGADFLIWQQNYTGPLSPAIVATVVPEPSTAVLMVLGITLLVRRRF